MALKADPKVVRELVHRYDRLQSLDAPCPGSSINPGIEGIVYTLCVLTGTRDEPNALAAARSLLAHPDSSRSEDIPPRPDPLQDTAATTDR
ncbi:DUF5133 domain-containing protein [Streptomyces sp. NBC_01433]|uniref:DUF5133 domain-containing protein n=1 Tax=Streptomyces sp. NBC_01433 TaxID=2903864 RepID=UPI00225A8E19|nr:DUF5133 domain-containing protein [Streptomyces sp. NBC_01433]MCX4678950.1 DUF5133 domain-containing protein [Streptomyces sp. NBC_01433]